MARQTDHLETDSALIAGNLAARRICRRAMRGIELPAAFLPRAKRDAVFAVLALCVRIRETACAGPQLIEILRDRLTAIESGPLDLPLPEMRSEDQHALLAAAHAIRRHQIPARDFLQFAAALQSPVTRFATWQNLQAHCDGAGGTVARIVAAVLGMTHSDGADRATKLGIAIELTRILRDLKRDRQRGAIYLPLADFASVRYSERDFLADTVDERFRALIAIQADRAQQLYGESSEAIRWLADDGSRLFAGVIIATGLNMLQIVQRRWRDLLNDLPRLTTGRMIRALPRAWRLARK
jgi:phytoene synthase